MIASAKIVSYAPLDRVLARPGTACWNCSDTLLKLLPATTNAVHAQSTSSDPVLDRSSAGALSPVNPT